MFHSISSCTPNSLVTTAFVATQNQLLDIWSNVTVTIDGVVAASRPIFVTANSTVEAQVTTPSGYLGYDFYPYSIDSQPQSFAVVNRNNYAPTVKPPDSRKRWFNYIHKKFTISFYGSRSSDFPLGFAREYIDVDELHIVLDSLNRTVNFYSKNNNMICRIEMPDSPVNYKKIPVDSVVGTYTEELLVICSDGRLYKIKFDTRYSYSDDFRPSLIPVFPLEDLPYLQDLPNGLSFTDLARQKFLKSLLPIVSALDFKDNLIWLGGSNNVYVVNKNFSLINTITVGTEQILDIACLGTGAIVTTKSQSIFFVSLAGGYTLIDQFSAVGSPCTMPDGESVAIPLGNAREVRIYDSFLNYTSFPTIDFAPAYARVFDGSLWITGYDTNEVLLFVDGGFYRKSFGLKTALVSAVGSSLLGVHCMQDITTLNNFGIQKIIPFELEASRGPLNYISSKPNLIRIVGQDSIYAVGGPGVIVWVNGQYDYPIRNGSYVTASYRARTPGTTRCNFVIGEHAFDFDVTAVSSIATTDFYAANSIALDRVLPTSQSYLTPNIGNIDLGQTNLNLGFNFNFFGNTYSNIAVSTNGYITFGPDTHLYADPRFGSVAADTLYVDPENLYQGLQIVNTDPNNIVFGTLDSGETPGVYYKFNNNADWSSFRLRWVGISANAYPLGNSLPITTNIVTYNELPLHGTAFSVNDYVHGPGITSSTQVTSKIIYNKSVIAVKNFNSPSYNLLITTADTTIKKYSRVFQGSTLLGYVQGTNYTQITGTRVLGKTTTSLLVDGNIPSAVSSDLSSFLYRVNGTTLSNPIGYNLISDTFSPLTNTYGSVILLDPADYAKIYQGLTFTFNSNVYYIFEKGSPGGSTSITINATITMSTVDSAVFQYTEINFTSLPSLSATGTIIYNRNLLEISDPTPTITSATNILIEGNFAGLSTSVSSSAGSVYTFKKHVPVESSYTYEVGFYLGKSLQYIEFFYNNTRHSSSKLLGLATSDSNFKSISTQTTAGKSVVFASYADTGFFQLLGQGSFDYNRSTFQPRELEFIRVPAERSDWAKFEALVTQKISRLDKRYISLTYGYLAINNSEDLFNYPIATGDIITVRIPFGQSTLTVAPLLCIGANQQAIPAMPDSKLGMVPEIVSYQDNVSLQSVNSLSITVTISGDYQIPPYYRSFISNVTELDFRLTRSGITSTLSGINHSFLVNDIITVGNIVSSAKLYDTSSVIVVGSNSVLRMTLRTISGDVFNSLNFGTVENPYTRYREYQLYNTSPAEYMDNVVYRSTKLTITSAAAMSSTLSIPGSGLQIYINGVKQVNNLNITVSSNRTIEMHWLVPNYFQTNVIVYQKKVDPSDASNVFVPIGLWAVNNVPIVNQPSLYGPPTIASFTLGGQQLKSATVFTRGLESNVTTSTDFKSKISGQYLYSSRQFTGSIESRYLPFSTHGTGEINSDYITSGAYFSASIQGEYLPTSSTFLIDGPLPKSDYLMTYLNSNAIYALKENISTLMSLGLITAEHEISQEDHQARFMANYIQSLSIISNEIKLPEWARLHNILTGRIPNNIFSNSSESHRAQISSTMYGDRKPLFGQALSLRHGLVEELYTKLNSDRSSLSNLHRAKIDSNRLALRDLDLSKFDMERLDLRDPGLVKLNSERLDLRYPELFKLDPNRLALRNLYSIELEPNRDTPKPDTKISLQPEFIKLNYYSFKLDLLFTNFTNFKAYKLDHVFIKEKQISFRVEHKFIQVVDFALTLTPFLNVETSFRRKLDYFLNNPRLMIKRLDYQLYQEELWEMLEYTKYGAFDTYFLTYADQGRNSDNRFNLGTPKNYSPYLPYQSHEASALLKGSQHGIFYIHSGNVLAHIDGINVHYSFDYLYRFSNVKINSWTLGTGSVSGYNANQTHADENIRLIDQDPWAQNNIIWETRCSGDGNADGGWNGDGFSIQHQETYRFSVWIRRTSTSANGYVYHGCGTNSSIPVRPNSSGYTDANIVRIDDGIGDANPYFDVRPASNYEKDKWYLHIAYIYASDFQYDPANPGLFDSGLYDINGKRVKNLNYSGTDSSPSLGFKFHPSATIAVQRVYHYYSTDDTTRFQFFGPRVDIMDGFEPKLGALLRGGVWKKLPTIYSPPPSVPESLILDEYNRTFYMNVYVNGSTLHYGGFSGSLQSRQGRTYGFGSFDSYGPALTESQRYVNAEPINIVATDYWNYRLFFDYSEPEYSITVRDPVYEIDKVIADMGDVIRLDIKSVNQNEHLGFIIEPADVEVDYLIIGGGGGGGGGIGGGGGSGGVLIGNIEFQVYSEYPVRVGKAGYGTDHISSNLSVNGDNSILGFLAALGGGGGGSSFEGNIPNRFSSPGITLSTANVFIETARNRPDVKQVFYRYKEANIATGEVITPITYTGYNTNGYSPFTVPFTGNNSCEYSINIKQISEANRPVLVELRILQQTNNLDNIDANITVRGPGVLYSQKTLTYTGTGWHKDLFKGDPIRDGGTGNSTIVKTQLVTPTDASGNLLYTFSNSNLLSTTVFGYKIFVKAPYSPTEPNTTWYTRPAPGRETFSEEFDLNSLASLLPGKYVVEANSLYAPYLIYYNADPAFIHGTQSGIATFGNLVIEGNGPHIIRVQANGTPATGAVLMNIYNEYGMPVADLTTVNNNYASTGATLTLTDAVNGRPGTQLVDDIYELTRAAPQTVLSSDTSTANIPVTSLVKYMPSISTVMYDLNISQFLKDFGVWDFVANTTTTNINYMVNITEPGIYHISGSALDQATVEIDGATVLTLGNFNAIQSVRKYFPAKEISVNINAIADPTLRSISQQYDLTNYTVNTGLVALTIQPIGIVAGGHGGGGAFVASSGQVGLGGEGNAEIGGHDGANAVVHSSGLGGGGSGGGAGEPGLEPVFYAIGAFEQLSNVKVSTVHTSNNVVIAANGAIGANIEECWTVGAGGAGGISFYSNVMGIFEGFGGLYGGGNSGAISGGVGSPGKLNSGGGGGAASGDTVSNGADGGEGFIMLKYNKMFELDLDPGLKYFTEIFGNTKLTVITNGLGNLRWKVVCFPYVKSVCAPVKGPTFPTKWFQRGG